MMDEIYTYHGNSIPYVAVLCHSDDRPGVAPILDALASHGIKLCVLDESARSGGSLLKSCAVIALFSHSFEGSIKLQDDLFASQRKRIPLVPVRLDSSCLSETLERYLYARNAVLLSLYPDTDSAVQRILSAAALQVPRVTRAQKSAYRRMQLLLGAAVIAVVAFAALFIMNGSGSSITKAQRGALAVYGLTEEDLDKITAFVLAGDTLECTDNEYLVRNYSGESGDLYAMAALFLADDGWHRSEDGSLVVPGTLEDISFLSLLPNLRTLILVNQTASLPDLSSLKKLERIELIGCEFEDLTGISGCKTLHSLSLYDCDGLSTLSGMNTPQLEQLCLYLPNLNDLSSISGCSSLQRLEIRASDTEEQSVPINDYRALSSLKELRSLTLQNRSDLRNLDFLYGMDGLETLSISWCENLSDIQAVASCSQLIEFDLSFEEGMGGHSSSRTKHDLDLSPLSKLGHLVDIYLYGVSTDLDFLLPIASHPFYRLSFTGADLDLSNLSSVQSCEIIELRDYGSTDNLPYLRNIKTDSLSIWANAGGNYDLQSLPLGLTYLELRDYYGSDLSGLEKQTVLSELRIFNAPNLEDYSSLEGLKFSHLQLISLTTLPDFSRIAFRQNAVLELVMNGLLPNGLTDLDCLNALDPAYAQSSNLTLHIAQPALKDLSALERFRGDMLFISPGFERTAETLVEIGCFQGYQIEGTWNGFTSSGNGEPVIAEGESHFLSSFDELFTISDFDAQQVTSLTIVGGEVFPDNSREGMISIRAADGTMEYCIIHYETGDTRPITPGGLTDLSALSRFPNLKSLKLCAQPIESLEGLESLSHLTSLEISGCGLTDISIVFSLQSLRSLTIGETGVTALQGIQNLTSLEELDISHSGITDLSVLRDCRISVPFTLYLPSGQIRDFSPLSSIPHFRRLDISYNDYNLWRGVFDGCEIEHMAARQCFFSEGDYEEFSASIIGLQECER